MVVATASSPWHEWLSWRHTSPLLSIATSSVASSSGLIVKHLTTSYRCAWKSISNSTSLVTSSRFNVIQQQVVTIFSLLELCPFFHQCVYAYAYTNNIISFSSIFCPSLSFFFPVNIAVLNGADSIVVSITMPTNEYCPQINTSTGLFLKFINVTTPNSISMVSAMLY